MVLCKADGSGYHVVNGATAGPPYLQFLNDPQGLQIPPNLRLLPCGDLEALCSIPALNFKRCLLPPSQGSSTQPWPSLRSELCFCYGKWYRLSNE
mmetsp:Transcript_12002/g.28663  ORF Transcript_12002/g.28663 Transcript_12002/m.28663 type:complete len:95 (+) Transcript_12002:3-287(+)